MDKRHTVATGGGAGIEDEALGENDVVNALGLKIPNIGTSKGSLRNRSSIVAGAGAADKVTVSM